MVFSGWAFQGSKLKGPPTKFFGTLRNCDTSLPYWGFLDTIVFKTPKTPAMFLALWCKNVRHKIWYPLWTYQKVSRTKCTNFWDIFPTRTQCFENVKTKKTLKTLTFCENPRNFNFDNALLHDPRFPWLYSCLKLLLYPLWETKNPGVKKTSFLTNFLASQIECKVPKILDAKKVAVK